MQKRVAAMGSGSVGATLCDVRDKKAFVSVHSRASVNAGAVLLNMAVGQTQHVMNEFQRQAAREARDTKVLLSQVQQATGTREVAFGCQADHWYINDRPWPPKKVPGPGAGAEPRR